MTAEPRIDPLREARQNTENERLAALGHKRLPDGRCEHRWRNRTSRLLDGRHAVRRERLGVSVRCAFLAGWTEGRAFGAFLPGDERLPRYLWEREALRAAAQSALDLLPDLSVAYHQVGSLRDHADPKDKTGWNLHGIETCEDTYCLDALETIAALRAALRAEGETK